jgi:DNA-binding transcriptional ArsR family regulator
MDLSHAARALSALALESRLAAYRALIQAGPDGLPAGQLAELLNVPPSTLSASLNILTGVELVRRRRFGRSIIYSARLDQMRDLLGFLIRDCCNGAPELCAPVDGILKEMSKCGSC